jgi:hypothetical protein
MGLLCSIKCSSNQHTNAQTRTSMIIVGCAAAFGASAVHAGTAAELVCGTLSGCILPAAVWGAGVNNLVENTAGGARLVLPIGGRVLLPFCFVALLLQTLFSLFSIAIASPQLHCKDALLCQLRAMRTPQVSTSADGI